MQPRGTSAGWCLRVQCSDAPRAMASWMQLHGAFRSWCLLLMQAPPRSSLLHMSSLALPQTRPGSSFKVTEQTSHQDGLHRVYGSVKTDIYYIQLSALQSRTRLHQWTMLRALTTIIAHMHI